MAEEIPEDISDEQQDWRFLHSVAKSDHSLPKRGEKDFEPDGTGVQTGILAESRNAMYRALEGERKHSSKNHISATWFTYIGKARVDVARGPHFLSLGKADSSGTIWLLPEEVIYLVERGSMECWWPEGAPMSLQAVYAACIQAVGDIEKLQVYSYLKKIGFIVQRAPSYDHNIRILPERQILSPGILGLGLQSVLNFFYHCYSREPRNPQCLLWRNVYRSFDQAYRDLEQVPCYIPPHSQLEAVDEVVDEPEPPFRVVFNVWKPIGAFKKANPGDPHFRVAVVSAQDDRMPTLAQTASLFASVPVNESAKDRSPIQRLKEGWRNVILAVVDSGIISFFKLSDVGFGQEKIYIRPKFDATKRLRQKRNEKQPAGSGKAS